MNTTTSEVGEEVFVLGYPLTATMGDEIKLTTGVISSKSGFQGDISQYQISAPVQPGNSGGPLFDSKGNINYQWIQSGNRDEGQRQGQLMNNFSIQFECQVRFPAPMFYAYYSIVSRENIKCLSKLDNLDFAGYVEKDMIRAALNGCDLYIFPTFTWTFIGKMSMLVFSRQK